MQAIAMKSWRFNFPHYCPCQQIVGIMVKLKWIIIIVPWSFYFNFAADYHCFQVNKNKKYEKLYVKSDILGESHDNDSYKYFFL